MRMDFSGGKAFPPPRRAATLDRSIPSVETGFGQKIGRSFRRHGGNSKKKVLAGAAATRTISGERLQIGRPESRTGCETDGSFRRHGPKHAKSPKSRSQSVSQTIRSFSGEFLPFSSGNCNFIQNQTDTKRQAFLCIDP
ncbi:hypothetical protein [Rhodoblastus sp.]|uniref:hypothetical protein n=1 Tax=Rhodoblastus sp. TaxID=1962975 RepID=UPI003F99CEEE